MKIISHRGNLYGPEPEKENLPSRVSEAIRNFGFDVEIDLRVVSGELFLGHDSPQYEISKDFLFKNAAYLWIHAKDFDAVNFLKTTSLNWFWHEEDKFTLTSTGRIWAYPDVFLDGCIVNQPSESSSFWKDLLYQKMEFHGICHDNPADVRRQLSVY